MEPANEIQRSDDRAPATPRGWAMEGYWEDELLQFAIGKSDEQTECEGPLEKDAILALATSDF